MKKYLFTVVCLLIATIKVCAQDKILLQDVVNMRQAAKTVYEGMPRLFNVITSVHIEDGMRQENIVKSFQAGYALQVFYDNKVIVSDDIDTAASIDNTRNTPIEEYLTILDGGYDKTEDATISFSNPVYSSIKKNDDFYYLRVKYDSKFKQPYKTKQRVALIRLDKSSGKWAASVAGISFYNPAEAIDSNMNDVPVYRDTSSFAEPITTLEINKQIDSINVVSNAKERKDEAEYDKLVTAGNNALADRHYTDAADYYEKALDKRPMELALDNKLREVKRLIERNTYNYLKAKGDELKAERRYAEALAVYKQAQEQKPDADLTNTEIKEIRSVLLVVSPPRTMLDAKQPQQVIDQCKKLIREHKKEMKNYPELYFLTAKAYEELYLLKPENPGVKDNGEPRNSNLRDALDNYTLAIKEFPNYIDALIARANFYVRWVHNYTKAIADFELVLQDATDSNTDKPGYLVTIARWKDKQGNTADALANYGKAIALSRRSDSLYFNRGELLYRLNKLDDAKTNFDSAIKLNSKSKNSLFYRGLTYLASKNIKMAGIDFAKLQDIGMTPVQLKAVDSISNAFFLTAEEHYRNHNFTKAEAEYNNALEIAKCNANALHGKANIYTALAKEQANRGKDADARKSYQRSIYFNKQAQACNPNLSDAHFQEGMAHYAIAEFDLAVNSYTEAIRSDAKNVNAFIERANTYQTTTEYKKAFDDYVTAIKMLQADFEITKKNNNKIIVAEAIFKLSKTHQLCGNTLYFLKDYVLAMQYLNKALDYNDQNAEAYFCRGQVNDAQNELSRSIKDYGEALKLNADYRYYYANASANHKNKNYQQAIANFTQAMQIDSAGIIKNRFYLRAQSYFKNKAYDLAATDYATYEKTDIAKTDTVFLVDYGFAQLYLKQDSKAAANFAKALALDAGNAMALYGMACTDVRSGNFDKGLESFEKAFVLQKIKKDDLKGIEDDLLMDKLKENKQSRTKYNQFKKNYLNN